MCLGRCLGRRSIDRAFKVIGQALPRENAGGRGIGSTGVLFHYAEREQNGFLPDG